MLATAVLLVIGLCGSLTLLRNQAPVQTLLAQQKPLWLATYIDDVSPFTCASFGSAWQHGVHLHILGLKDPGNKLKVIRNGKIRKVVAMRDWLRSVPEEAVVVFNDATDVLYLVSPDEVYQAFLNISAKLSADTVLFAGERNLWPYFDDYPERPSTHFKNPDPWQRLALYPTSNQSSFRFANAGNWIARQPAALALMTRWDNLMKLRKYKTIMGHT
ncbi:hypothetical protein CYMTET_18294 [Cymbomonas tetramitiformis]|uniref:PLOD1-3-like GT domain-containing protein n=1 Tax=Cymbomonas tetramitiformis TaxID=36881 RepID=A0AAE0L620_9CHLO|nr:hypothetical protein CYMTET_18294 [Cymbomonas tetramitiformis]